MTAGPIRLIVQCILRLWDLEYTVYKDTDVEEEVEPELYWVSKFSTTPLKCSSTHLDYIPRSECVKDV